MVNNKNLFRESVVFGNFVNCDDIKTGGNQANAKFKRNVLIGNDLTLGLETSTTTNGVTAYTDTGGNIIVKKEGITYTLTPTILSHLSTISSNIQDQINDITIPATPDLSFYALKDSPTFTGTMTLTNGDFLISNGGVLNSGNYNLKDIGGNAGVISVGTFTSPSFLGQGIHLKIYFHEGFNGLNSQDYVCEIFFKVANEASGGGDISGFPANSWCYRYGRNQTNSYPTWLIANSNKLSYTLYITTPYYNVNSFYEVSYSKGCSWTNDDSYFGNSLPSSTYSVLPSIDGYTLQSPLILKGTTEAPTPATVNNSNKIATTAFVKAQGYATKVSPTFSGTPLAPTPTSIYNNSTKIATTEWVQNLITGLVFGTKPSEYIYANGGSYSFYVNLSYPIYGNNNNNGIGYLSSYGAIGIPSGYGWNSSNGRWKAPVTGKYLIQIKFSVANAESLIANTTINLTFYLKDANNNLISNTIIYSSPSGNIVVDYNTFVYIPLDGYFYVETSIIPYGTAVITFYGTDSVGSPSDKYAFIKVSQVY
jgi:hypothetical protein